jgi:hypothetical protein
VASVLEGQRETVDWFLERIGELDLIVFGYCFGLVSAVDLASRVPVRAIGCVTPPFGQTEPTKPTKASLKRRIVRTVRRLPYLPGWMLERARFGRPHPRRSLRTNPALMAMRDPCGVIRSALEAAPLWVLTGELDVATPVLRQIESDLDAGSRFALDVMEDAVVYKLVHPATQAMQLERIIDWAEHSLALTEVRR